MTGCRERLALFAKVPSTCPRETCLHSTTSAGCNAFQSTAYVTCCHKMNIGPAKHSESSHERLDFTLSAKNVNFGVKENGIGPVANPILGLICRKKGFSEFPHFQLKFSFGLGGYVAACFHFRLLSFRITVPVPSAADTQNGRARLDRTGMHVLSASWFACSTPCCLTCCNAFRRSSLQTSATAKQKSKSGKEWRRPCTT